MGMGYGVWVRVLVWVCVWGTGMVLSYGFSICRKIKSSFILVFKLGSYVPIQILTLYTYCTLTVHLHIYLRYTPTVHLLYTYTDTYTIHLLYTYTYAYTIHLPYIYNYIYTYTTELLYRVSQLWTSVLKNTVPSIRIITSGLEYCSHTGELECGEFGYQYCSAKNLLVSHTLVSYW